jgi:hypothetical protein
MIMRKALCSLAVACLFTFATAVSNAATINFDEFPANNNNVAITTSYNYLGVTFGTDNSGTWGGISNGNPGNWDLEGTNGSAFLGNNGQNNYNTSILFTTAVSSISFDVSRSRGSSPGQTITLLAYAGSLLLGSTGAIALGDINSWTTFNLNIAGIDKVVLDGSGSESVFSPYGIDNLQFSAVAPVAEPASLILLLAGIAGLAGLRSGRRS